MPFYFTNFSNKINAKTLEKNITSPTQNNFEYDHMPFNDI